ncbi:MAG: Flp pilus assembly protein CpaB [Kiritimatiellaeota bacterium]|nr:Flp pilus assembly protein CpaB [Kiritimatiellota bacterium]
MKQHLLLAIAVVTGLLAAFATKQYISSRERDLANLEGQLRNRYKQTDAIVFKRDMPRDTLIKEDDIGYMEVPLSALRPGAVRIEDRMQLVGKRTVNSVKTKEPVFWSDIEGGEVSLRSGLAREVKNGMVAASINVSGSASVSGLVQPNDHVNVVGTFVLDAPDRPNEKEQVTLTVLQNVTVLATGRETSRTLSRLSADRASSYSTVTLHVTPREAETLIACEQNRGRLTLTLRNPDDLGYEEELPTVDFKYIREVLDTLNKKRQETLIRRGPTPTLGR